MIIALHGKASGQFASLSLDHSIFLSEPLLPRHGIAGSGAHSYSCLKMPLEETYRRELYFGP